MVMLGMEELYTSFSSKSHLIKNRLIQEKIKKTPGSDHNSIVASQATSPLALSQLFDSIVLQIVTRILQHGWMGFAS